MPLLLESRFSSACSSCRIALTKADAKNADAWNLLGFTYRKLGQLDDSDAAYLTVLSINPDHLGALEYQGELFITMLKENLARK